MPDTYSTPKYKFKRTYLIERQLLILVQGQIQSFGGAIEKNNFTKYKMHYYSSKYVWIKRRGRGRERDSFRITKWKFSFKNQFYYTNNYLDLI